LSTTNSFVVVVNELDVAPILPVQTNRTINVFASLIVTNVATDPDIPLNSLTYQLLSAPTNASISADGTIAWTPELAQGLSTNVFTTMVTDTNPWAINAQHLSASNSFSVIVAAAPPVPVIESIAVSNNISTIRWSTAPGYVYRLQVTDDLGGTNWDQLPPDVLAQGTTASATNAIEGSTQQFYRVLVVP